MSATSRSVYRDTVLSSRDGDGSLIPLAGAEVRFYLPQPGTPAPLPVPLYGGPDATEPLTLPFVTGARGEIEVWADTPTRARQIVFHRGAAASDEIVDIEPEPGASATDQDIANAILVHEAADDPHDQYLTQEEGDLAYLKLTGGTLTGNLNGTGVSLTGTIEADRVQANVVYAVNSLYARGSDVFNYVENDSRYEQLSKKGVANGYVPLDAGTKIPNAYLPDLAITNTFVVTSEAEMLALNAQTGDVCVRLDTTENYILAQDPATVLANWTKLAASTTAGNTTVVRREEFAPAAAATTVALAAVPTTVLSCSRNGVEQSSVAGHFTVAGVTLTFTDAFVAGERVSVVYEVGSSAPAPINGYTKAESDARYEPIDTMYTKVESDARYLQSSVAGTTYLPLTGGTVTGEVTVAQTASLLFDGPTTASDVRLSNDGSGLVVTINDNPQLAIRDGVIRPNAGWAVWLGGTATADRFSRVYGKRLDLAESSTGTEVFRAIVNADTQPRFRMYANGDFQWGPGGSTATDTTLRRTGVGALRADSNLGVGVTPAAWGGGYLGVQVGATGALWSNTSGAFTFLSTNEYWDGTSRRALTAAAATELQVDFTGFKVNTAPSVAAGAAQTFTTRLTVDQAGSVGVGVTPTTGWARTNIQIGHSGAVSSDSGGSSLVLGHNTRYDGSNNYALTTGTSAFIGLSNGEMRLWSAPSVAAGAVQAFTARMIVTQTGTLTLTPDAGQAALDARGPVYIGIPGGSAGIVGSNHFGLTLPGSGYAFYPVLDNGYNLGSPTNRWGTVYAVTGAINTSVYEAKESFVPLDPATCAVAVLETDWMDYRYRPPEGAEARHIAETAHARHQKGYVLQSPVHKTHALFGLDDRQSASPGSDLAVVACALQEVLRRLAIVEGKLPA